MQDGFGVERGETVSKVGPSLPVRPAGAGAKAVREKLTAVLAAKAKDSKIKKSLANNPKGLLSLARLTTGATHRVKSAGASATAVRARQGENTTKAARPHMVGTEGFKPKPAGDGARAVREFGQRKTIGDTANSGSADGVVREARQAIADRRRSRKYLIAGGGVAAGGLATGAGAAAGSKLK